MQQWRKLHLQIWDNPQVMKLPLQARILYLHMISIADDHGRFIADGAVLRKAFIFDDYNCEQVGGWRGTIERAGLIKTYEKDGELYAYHPNWKEYQGGRGTPIRPDRKKSAIPTPYQPIANQSPTDCQPTADEKQTQKERKKEIERKNIPLNGEDKSIKNDEYKRISDQISYEMEKTFRTISEDKWPKMSFIMLKVKEQGQGNLEWGAAKVIEGLGKLRLAKNFHDIKDFTPYLTSILKI